MMYRAAGPKLRQHIADLPQGSAARQAWEGVYHQIQHGVFGGKEYGETRLQYAEVQGIAWDHAEQTREGGFQSQGPSQFFGSFAAWTDPSLYYKSDETGRPINEDAIAQFRDGAIVADGMGGHGGGDKASAIVVEEFVDYVSKGGDMAQGFSRAAQAVHDFNGSHGRSGAVAVAMRVLPQEGAMDKLEVVHAGDAKLVVFVADGQGGYQVQSRTIDHGLRYEEQKQGKRSTLEIRIDPNANVVASTLGGNMEHPTIEHQYMDLPEGARVVMGSDGLWDNVSFHEVAEVLSRHVTADGALAELKQILDWKMDRLDRARNLLRAGKGSKIRGQVINKYTGEMEVKNINVVAIPDSPGFYLSRLGDVYNDKGQVVDHYKFDNRALYVYHHDIPQ
jgi:protein phosphatase